VRNIPEVFLLNIPQTRSSVLLRPYTPILKHHKHLNSRYPTEFTGYDLQLQIFGYSTTETSDREALRNSHNINHSTFFHGYTVHQSHKYFFIIQLMYLIYKLNAC